MVVSPLAFGSVHPWVYRPLEAVLFGLAILWMVKIAALAGSASTTGEAEAAARTIAIPLAVIAAYVIFQITPLPPSILRALSPSTFEVYSQALDGWPASRPYDHLGSNRRAAIAADSETAAGPLILPTVDEVKKGVPIPFAPRSAKPPAKAASPRQSSSPISTLATRIYGGRWRPLALAPLLTLSSLLALLSCACAFLLTAFYPLAYGDDSESVLKFIRVSLRVILVTGFLVAFVGLIERATWNGKILWFFVPYDWGHPLFEPLLRARGPFVDPDHFAGYLAIIFPLTLACAVFPNLLTPRRATLPFRIQYGVASFVIFLAILLSLSRGGWLALILGSLVMFLLAVPRRAGGSDAQSSGVSRLGGVRLAIAGMVILLGASMIFIGPDARVDTVARVNQSAAEMETIVGRIAAWKGGIALIRDFPIFGVGLGGWSEIFERYQLPPWQVLFFAQAHNDYVQLLAETGLVGLALFGWLAVRIIRKVAEGARSLEASAVPIFAALAGGLVAAGVVEVFDFDLRIPAIALLFTVFAGLLVRLTTGPGSVAKARSRPWAIRARAVAVSMVALVLAGSALAQDATVYPYNLAEPENLAEARALLVTYPANVFPHLALIRLDGDAMAPEVLDTELKRAVWLGPLDPNTRDLYAQALVNAKRYGDAFEQVKASVLNCPGFGEHHYLVPKLIVWLPPELKKAIEKGLNEAVDRGYEHAPETLGEYYETVGQLADEAHAFERAATRQDDPVLRAKYLRESGEAFARAGAVGTALIAFQEAAESAPDDSSIYSDMAVLVYGPRHDVDGARRAVDLGIENGADSFALTVALADAALAAGDRSAAEDALEKALRMEPNDDRLLAQLGTVYAADNRPDRAILVLNRALEIEPNSPQTYSLLGNIEEGRYQYYNAERAYRRAAELSPDNPQYREQLGEFERKLKATSAENAKEIIR